jgi:acyl-CoA synthetase (AMP-forming)/AMP-acid ligase II
MDAPTLHRNLVQRVNVGDMLTRTAWRTPEREAVVDGDRRYTYEALNALTNRLANTLRGRGIGRGDAVLLVAGNSAEFLAVYFACAKIGTVCVPANLRWGPREVAHVVDHCAPRLALVEPPFASLVPEALEAIVLPFELEQDSSEPACYVEDRDPVAYMYTSGTGSSPKGAVQSHLAGYIVALSGALAWNTDEDWCYALFMPLFHTATLAIATSAILRGSTTVLMRGFEPKALLETIEHERITYFLALPMMIRALIESPGFEHYDLSSLRTVGYAMAPMPEEDLRRAIEAFGCGFALGFGQTEMSPLTTLFSPSEQLRFPGSVGRQIPNVQTAIMDADGGLLLPGQTGEIVYRSPQTMSEYLDDEDATEQAFRFGWFHSGDLGRFDEHGVLWFEDRLKDVIKTGGENVGSIEIERALSDVEPRILECVVIGLPHAKWGEMITAVVIPRPGAALTEEDVIDAARRKLPALKVPKRVIFTAELPRTSTGKVQKAALRGLYSRRYESSPGSD